MIQRRMWTSLGLGALSNAHAAGSDAIKVGQIGCGGRGRGAADNICEATCLRIRDAFGSSECDMHESRTSWRGVVAAHGMMNRNSRPRGPNCLRCGYRLASLLPEGLRVNVPKVASARRPQIKPKLGQHFLASDEMARKTSRVEVLRRLGGRASRPGRPDAHRVVDREQRGHRRPQWTVRAAVRRHQPAGRDRGGGPVDPRLPAPPTPLRGRPGRVRPCGVWRGGVRSGGR